MQLKIFKSILTRIVLALVMARFGSEPRFKPEPM